MAAAVERYLDQLDGDETADRRNGHYRRHLLTTLGDIELCVPRTRRFSPTAVIRAYARRAAEIDRVILAGFVLGLSTRKVGETLLAMLGQKVSATTVSQVAKDPRSGGRRLSPPAAQEWLHGADARRRGAGPQDRRRLEVYRSAAAGSKKTIFSGYLRRFSWS